MTSIIPTALLILAISILHSSHLTIVHAKIMRHRFLDSTTTSSEYAAATPPCSGESIFHDIQAKYGRFEPSDLVWNTSSLYVVSDSGFVAMLDFDGYVQNMFGIGRGYDLEAISLHPFNSQRLLLGNEDPPLVLEYDVVSKTILRTFDLTNGFPAHTQKKQNAGMESLVFIAIPNEKEGGIWLAGNQQTSEVVAFTLPLQSSETATSVTFLGSFLPPGPGRDLSSLTTYNNNGDVYALFDKGKSLIKLEKTQIMSVFAELKASTNGEYKRLDISTMQPKSQWEFHIDGQEGIAFVDLDEFNTYVFIAIDESKKKGDRKDLLRFTKSQFDSCFLKQS